jgi:hypothetical protein
MMETTIVGRAALILALLGTVIACGRHENPETSNIDPAVEPELFIAVCPDNDNEDTTSWRFRVRFNDDNKPRRMLMNGTSNNTEKWALCPSSKVTWLAKKEFEICFDKEGNSMSPFDPAGTLCLQSTLVNAEKPTHRVGPFRVRADADEREYNYRVCYMKCDGRNPQWDPVIIVEK